MKYLEKLKEYIIRYKKNIIIISSYAFITLIFAVSLVLIYNSNTRKIKSLENKNKLSLVETVEEIEEIEIEKEKIYVDVKGAVAKPGVYVVEADKRVSDAVVLAGGFTKEANTRYVNLSKILKDEMVIIIYTNNEVKNLLEDVSKETPCICENIVNDACIQDETEDERNEDSLININTATLEELMTLTGIGESKANAIIDYREENGDFTNIEDIMEVSGISESTYSKIKDFITIK